MALSSLILILISLFFPLYSIRMNIVMSGVGEINYSVILSPLLGNKVEGKFVLDDRINSMLKENLQREAKEPENLGELLDMGGLNLEEIKEKAKGLPIDISSLPLDVNQIRSLPTFERIPELVFNPKEEEIEKFLPVPELKGNLSLIIRILPLVLFLSPPLISIARRKYLDAGIALITLAILPLIISYFIPFFKFELLLGGKLVLASGFYLIVAFIYKKWERRIFGIEEEEEKKEEKEEEKRKKKEKGWLYFLILAIFLLLLIFFVQTFLGTLLP